MDNLTKLPNIGKIVEIKSNRLIINTISEEEIQALIKKYASTIPELSYAYQEMYNNCKQHMDEFVWYVPWKICLLDDKKEVGYASFKGFNEGHPEIGYGINEEYQGNGYATEAVKALCKWALEKPEVIAIEAETEISNIISNNVLIKVGFIETGIMGVEGKRYILNR